MSETKMQKVLVTIRKRETIEYIASRVLEVPEAEVAQLQGRPLQARFWAEHVVPFNLSPEDWHALEDGRKTVSFEALEVDVKEPLTPSQTQE